jgi:hypothetical protein
MHHNHYSSADHAHHASLTSYSAYVFSACEYWGRDFSSTFDCVNSLHNSTNPGFSNVIDNC